MGHLVPPMQLQPAQPVLGERLLVAALRLAHRPLARPLLLLNRVRVIRHLALQTRPKCLARPHRAVKRADLADFSRLAVLALPPVVVVALGLVLDNSNNSSSSNNNRAHHSRARRFLDSDKFDITLLLIQYFTTAK